MDVLPQDMRRSAEAAFPLCFKPSVAVRDLESSSPTRTRAAEHVAEACEIEVCTALARSLRQSPADRHGHVRLSMDRVAGVLS